MNQSGWLFPMEESFHRFAIEEIDLGPGEAAHSPAGKVLTRTCDEFMTDQASRSGDPGEREVLRLCDVGRHGGILASDDVARNLFRWGELLGAQRKGLHASGNRRRDRGGAAVI